MFKPPESSEFGFTVGLMSGLTSLIGLLMQAFEAKKKKNSRQRKLASS